MQRMSNHDFDFLFGRWTVRNRRLYDQELFGDRMVYVRFLWTNDEPDAARWEQAFSVDGGKTWETNWIMQFERAS